MESKTEMGLLLIVFGMVIGILSTIASAAVNSQGGYDLSGLIIPAIAGFFGLILLFVGWILMLIGRKEFGEKHAQFVIYSLVALIIGVVIVIIGGIVSALGSMAGGIGPEVTIDYVEMAKGARGGLMFSFIGGVILTIGAILLVYNLENDLGKRILFSALVASIVISLIITMYSYSGLTDLIEKLEETPEEDQEQEFFEGSSKIDVISGLEAISSLLLMIAYFIPYDRIKKGDLKPVAPPTPPYGMPPYPQPYYPYQPYPPYQPYQPPGQPPYGPPEGIKPETVEGKARLVTPEVGAVRPTAVSPVSMETKKCTYCGTQIPKESTACPVCGKGQ